MYYEFNGNILPQVRLMDREIYESPSRHRKRRIDEYVFYAIKEENGIKYELKEGEAILLDTEYSHGGWKPSVCEYYYIHFRHPQFVRYEVGEDFAEKCFQRRNNSLKEDNWSYSCYQDSWVVLPKGIRTM